MTRPAFTDQELQAMHRFCLDYRDLVRRGGKPSGLQDVTFMAYQTICYQMGVAHV